MQVSTKGNDAGEVWIRKLTMVVSQIGWLWDVSFLDALRRHLVDGAICHAGDKLLALGAPCSATHLRAQYRAIGSRHQLALGQVRHKEVALVGDDGAKASRLRHRVRY